MMRRKIVFLLQALAILAIPALTASGQVLQRTAQAGGVRGVATPLNLTDAKAGTIDIKIGLDADSFPPDFDVAKIALLSDGKEVIVPAAEWSGENDGHHITGTLSFPADDLRSAKILIMTLQRFERESDLAFSWEGPFPSQRMQWMSTLQ